MYQNKGVNKMSNDTYEIDFGFVITKTPTESQKVLGALKLANKALEERKSVGLFLLSDGVWCAKKNQKNTAIKYLINILEKGGSVIASGENLEAAGIDNNDVLKGIQISEKPYGDLVDLIMEKWRRVVTI
jgi:sulfur relay (sulfurtransferase) complex TusBCD TusD component (DsrE family)